MNIFNKDYNLPILEKADSAIKKFTIGERGLFYVLATIFVTSGLLLISGVNNLFTTVIPSHGGTMTEGIVGSPRFINPIISASDADRDLTAIVFSGLMRPTTKGTLELDLAENYKISEDGLSYTVKIKENAFFHDGKPITADDVIFTVEKAKDPLVKSPKRAEWEDVSVKKIDDKMIVFKLPRPYYPFVENLTLGIIPKHLWKDTGPEEFAFSLKNISPIGSGPFKIDKVEKNSNGIPTSYKLSSFKKYANGEPYIKNLTVRLFSNEKDMMDAWQSSYIDSMGGISPNETEKIISEGGNIQHLKLPRVYGAFFNQNQMPIFTDKAVRKALNMVIDRKNIVDKVLFGFGTTLEGPLPDEFFATQKVEKKDVADSISTSTIAEARKLLSKSGWILNKGTNIFEKTEKVKKNTVTKPLAFTISTPNVPELKEVAEILQNQWKELGASVEVKLFELSDLTSNVIRPRKYDVLLFGQIIGRNPDLFAFWHSSQRNDPGYNIALYANSKVDKFLDEARQSRTQDAQMEVIKKIYNEINADTPAVFLYTPDYLYVVRKNLKGLDQGSIASPSERFANINNWFIQSEKIWNFLNK
jgi:peptide/nickel transport system substrate-binding protein